MVPNWRHWVFGHGRIPLHRWPHKGHHRSRRAEGRSRRNRTGAAKPPRRGRSRGSRRTPPPTWRGCRCSRRIASGCHDHRRAPPRFRPRAAGQLQGPWLDSRCAGDLERSRRSKRDELLAALSTKVPTPRVERGGKFVTPRSELQRQLADTWTELLELNKIDIDENVFALGAESITVTQMLSRLRARFGLHFSFKDIIDAPTVAALSARLE